MDIHPFAKGVHFKDLGKNKKDSFIGDEKAYFASLDDLIKMKEAAGRAKDIEDLKILKKIKMKLSHQ